MVPIVTAMYVAGLLIIPGMLAAACGWISRRWAEASVAWKDLTCSFTLALVPVGFGMWLAHFSNHLLSGWSTVIPVVERFFSRVSSGQLPASMDRTGFLLLNCVFLDLGLLLTLYTAWRVARRLASGDRMALAVMSPWAVSGGRALFGRCLDCLPADANARNDDALGAKP